MGNADPFNEPIRSSKGFWQNPSIMAVKQQIKTAAKTGGFLAVVGESGSGKTSLLVNLMDEMRDDQNLVFIRLETLGMEQSKALGKRTRFNHVINAILDDVAPNAKKKSNAEGRERQCMAILKDSYRNGRRHCLVVDEAHALDDAMLRQFKRFLEIQEGYNSVLSVVLLGQPELAARLNESNIGLREVIQRIEIINMVSVTQNNIRDFIDHRLAAIGKKSTDIIDESGVKAVIARLHDAGASRGAAAYDWLTPLAVQNLLNRAMTATAKAGAKVITAQFVEVA